MPGGPRGRGRKRPATRLTSEEVSITPKRTNRSILGNGDVDAAVELQESRASLRLLWDETDAAAPPIASFGEWKTVSISPPTAIAPLRRPDIAEQGKEKIQLAHTLRNPATPTISPSAVRLKDRLPPAAQPRADRRKVIVGRLRQKLGTLREGLRRAPAYNELDDMVVGDVGEFGSRRHRARLRRTVSASQNRRTSSSR